MSAKGIARLGLACIVAGAFNTSYAMSVSNLVISEIMANPAALPDAQGEWFELFNPTDEIINLRDVSIGDDGSNSHKIETDLLILPSMYLTLARSHDPGFTPDYVYDNFSLTNTIDEIILNDSLGQLRLDYGANFVSAGFSQELTALPMTLTSFSRASENSIYGSGDFGTPGRGSLLPVYNVPLPGTAWLFVTGLLAVFFGYFRAVLRVPVKFNQSTQPLPRNRCCNPSGS